MFNLIARFCCAIMGHQFHHTIRSYAICYRCGKELDNAKQAV